MTGGSSVVVTGGSSVVVVGGVYVLLKALSAVDVFCVFFF